MGEPPPAEYMRAPRPWGLGFGDIELEGAVDYIMGMGQLRWAATETKDAVLGEIRQQLRTQGLCTRVTLPQSGPWEHGTHNILRDLMRTIGQLGLAVVWEQAGQCQHEGPQLVRVNWRRGKRKVGQGVVLEHVYGKNTWLEKWAMGRGEVYAVTGPTSSGRAMASGTRSPPYNTTCEVCDHETQSNRWRMSAERGGRR